jgi:hypothetical protein
MCVNRLTTKVNMKISAITILLLLSLTLFAQKNILGRYRDYFGGQIELKADSTFKYAWHFDLSYSWTKGIWFLNNDTIYFHMIPTYDTVNYKNNIGAFVDKLILSVDETSERLNEVQYAVLGLSSGGQNKQNFPEKLFFKRKDCIKFTMDVLF